MGETQYWICTNDECSEYDGQIFSAVRELAICPQCSNPLRLLNEDYDPLSEDARVVSGMEDRLLARAYIAALAKDYPEAIPACEFEIRKRHGKIHPKTWAREVIIYGGRFFDSRTKRYGILELENDRRIREHDPRNRPKVN